MRGSFLISALMLAVSMAAVHAQAQGMHKHKHDQEQMSHENYGTAGCGLGSLAFQDQPGMIQVVAATLNATGVQTFAISTGTSNCGEASRSARLQQYIDVNKVALDNDLARGTGESVASLAVVMGCHNTTFATSLRRTYTVGSSPDQLAQAATQACQL